MSVDELELIRWQREYCALLLKSLGLTREDNEKLPRVVDDSPVKRGPLKKGGRPSRVVIARSCADGLEIRYSHVGEAVAAGYNQKQIYRAISIKQPYHGYVWCYENVEERYGNQIEKKTA